MWRKFCRSRKILTSPKNRWPKWMREKSPAIARATVQAYARLFKSTPIVPDKGINNVILDLLKSRPDFKDYIGWPEPFRRTGRWKGR